MRCWSWRAFENGGGDDGKSEIIAQCSKLPDAKASERSKAYWAEKLQRLEKFLGA